MVNGFWISFIGLYFLAGCAGDPPPIIESEKPLPSVTISCGEKPIKHIDGLHSLLIATNPSTLTWLEIEDSKKEQFLAAFNASPPASKIQNNARVRIYHRYDSMNIMVIVADVNGCVLTGSEFPRPQVLMWLRGLPTTKSRPPLPHEAKKNPTKT